MGGQCDPKGVSRSTSSTGSEATFDISDLHNSPLDLSKTSIRFPTTNPTVSVQDSTPLPTDYSENVSYTESRQISVDCSYEKPSISTQPKSEWHYRNIRDLANGHIPFLSGDGPQRTPLRITVPENSNQAMYLAITVVTDDGEFHDSKVIVPGKTRVDPSFSVGDNNLNYLMFNDCPSTDRFDLVTRCVYLQISPEEHEVRLKEVRVHMFNLYQNQMITKEIIAAKKLYLCRLAFWFCFFDGKHYIPISQRSYSCIIQEQKTSTRSNVLQQTTTNNQTNSIISLSIPSALSRYSEDMENDHNDDRFLAHDTE